MTALPDAFAWLKDEPGPKMLVEALKLYGTLEFPGAPDNPVIVAWADEIAAALPTPYNNWAADWYKDDSTAWCGSFAAIVAVRANPEGRPERNPPDKYLAALEWQNFGVGVGKKEAELGDVLVFQRAGGGHVGLYVGENPRGTIFYVLGGNQADSVNITAISVNRLVAVRRPPYHAKPMNVRKVIIQGDPDLSTNEA